MKQFLQFLILLCAASTALSQGNHIHGGGEFANFGIIDISAVHGLSWSTERSATPGYFSLVDTALFTGCTNDANINGYVKKYGSRAFTFPVGTGSIIRPLSISAPSLPSDAYASAWIAGNPATTADPTAPFSGFHAITAVTPPVAQVSELGQWDWQTGEAGNLGLGTTGTGAGLTITVSIPDMTNFALANQLRLVGWNGQSWVTLSHGATASGNTENSTLTGTMIPGITAIGIGSVSKFKPFHLSNFTGQARNCNAIITWETYNENSIAFYVVEKSFDNLHFAEADKILPKKGTDPNTYHSASSHTYGIAYYRIRIVSEDGSYTYTTSILLSSDCGVKEYMQLYPNPVTSYDNVYLNFSTPYRGKAILVLFNAVGQKMAQKQLLINSDINLVTVEVARYAAGSYFLNLLKEDGQLIGSTQKFIKQ